MTPSTAPQQSYSQSQLANSALLEGLKPPLRSTLCSLNINLDYELARYRYAKRGEAQPNVAPPQFQSRRQRSLNLINVPAPAKPVRSPGLATAAPPPPPNPRISQTATAPATVVAAASGNGSEVANLRSALVRQAAPQPDNYLESSEALLQNFDNSYPAAGPGPVASPTSKSWFEGINTPLGLGALMLLLVASAGFGFVLVNPSAAQNLFGNTPLARLLPSTAVDEVEAVDGVTADADAIASPEGPPLSALGPDLSQREFSTLDLNTLSNLPSNTSPLGGQPAQLVPGNVSAANGLGPGQANAGNAAANGTAVAGTPQQVNQIPQNITPAPRPAAIAPTYQEPAAPAPAPAPAPQSAPAVESVPAASNAALAASQAPVSAYYVVSDYTGDPSLDEAREVVDDAYVRNFDVGARIQLGAFSSEEGAAALTEELNNQGIEAQIYEP